MSAEFEVYDEETEDQKEQLINSAELDKMDRNKILLATAKKLLQHKEMKRGLSSINPETNPELIINELDKLVIEQMKYNTQIEIINDNIYEFNVKLRGFGNEILNDCLNKLNNKKKYDYFEINIKLNKNLYPFYPPQLKFIRPRMDSSIYFKITNLKMMQLKYWSPARSLSYIINNLREIINIHGIINMEFENNANVSYLNIEDKLSNLEIDANDIDDLDMNDYVITKVADMEVNKKPKKNNKPNGQGFVAGTGYGGSSSAVWDINKYLKAQEQKNKETNKQIIAMYEALDQDIKDNNNASCYEILINSPFVPFINNFLSGTSLLEMNKKQELYENILKILLLLSSYKSLIKILLFNNASKNILHANNNIFTSLLQVQEEFDVLKSIKINKENAFITTINKIIKRCNKYKPEEDEDKKDDEKDEKEINKYTLYYDNMKKFGIGEFDKTEYPFSIKEGGKVKVGKNAQNIMEEISNVKKSASIAYDSSIFTLFDPDNITAFVACITGPKDTPYSNGCFLIDISLPGDYPAHCPKALINTTGKGSVRFNPNLYACFSPCTKILMSTGKTKSIGEIVKDYKNGDKTQKVCGDDGTERNIIGTTPLTHGQMYKVEQTNAKTYYVNGGHKLVVTASGIAASTHGKRCVYYVKCNKLKQTDIDKNSKNKCKGCPGIRTISTTFDDEEAAIGATILFNLDKDYSLLNHTRDQIVVEGDILEISVNDWMKEWCCNKKGKERLHGYKAPRPIIKNNKNIKFNKYLPPYILGLWLGDGKHDSPLIWNRDEEIIEYIQQFCESNNLEFTKKWTHGSYANGDNKSIDESGDESSDESDDESSDESDEENTDDEHKFGCYALYMGIKNNSTFKNPFTSALKEVNLRMNKHIPDIYLNSPNEQDRLEILAGILDSDGCLKLNKTKNGLRYVLTQSESLNHKKIILQVKQLCESLGIRVTGPYKELKRPSGLSSTSDGPPFGRKFYKDGTKTKIHWSISLGGKNIMNIPCLVKRKQCKLLAPDINFYNSTTSKLTITKTDEKETFTAIEVDGNNRYLLSDCTVVHNCGKICLSLLGTWRGNASEGWNPAISTIQQVLISIQSLILVDEPYFNEPGYQDSMGTPHGTLQSNAYNDDIRLQTMKWAILDHLKNPIDAWKIIINNHFYYKKDDVIETCSKWVDEAMTKKAEYKNVFEEIKKYLNKLELINQED
jgi:ubiquitin-protein ligase